MVAGVLDWIAELSLVTVVVATVLVQLAETLPVVGLAVPGDIAVLLAGTRVQSSAAYAMLVAASVVGQLTGESLGFALGRYCGPGLRTGRVGRWAGRDRWDRAERLLARRGPAALVTAHFVPVAHAAAPLVAGTLGMPYRRFLWSSAVGSLAWSCLYVGLGVAGGSAYREYGARATAVSVGVVAAVLLSGLAWCRLRARLESFPVPTVPADRPLRVAVVAESFLPAVNGVSGSVCRVVEHLTAAGHEVLVVAPGPAPERHSGAEVHPVRAIGLPGYRAVRIGVIRPGALRRVLERYRPDVVHLASPAVLGASGLVAARRLGVPTVAVFQTDLAGFAHRYGLPGVGWLAWAWLRWIHTRADRTLAPSRPVLTELVSRGVPRVQLWPRGVDTVAFDPRHRNAAVRAALAPGGELLVGYVGRLAAEKRLELLAGLDHVDGVHLVLIGDGPQRTRLQHALPDAAFTGLLRGAELSSAVASLDVFVQAGTDETFCQAVQEALAAGVPAVVPAAGGPLDLVQHGENGLHYAPGSATELRAAVERLRDEPSMRRALAARARPSVRNRTWASIGDALLGHYAQLNGLPLRSGIRGSRSVHRSVTLVSTPGSLRSIDQHHEHLAVAAEHQRGPQGHDLRLHAAPRRERG